ncbi:hypothetical protein [Streptomyces specialis]|uniref:hypothetical protein n=1 Tax=Streptomyces specialis TaxID=498367 RepID=UPI00073E13D3|nr:hypothetical protein [Streptomyces specialis]
MDFELMRLLASIGGGMLGAAVGAVPAFVLVGFLAAGTFAYNVATGNDPAAAPLSDLVPFGPLLSPHIAFAGGVAAAAYAGRRGLLPSGKDAAVPLAGLDAPAVLFVGGAFGGLGYALQWLFTEYSPTVDGNILLTPVVTAIVASNVAARLIFGRSGLFGTVPPGESRWVPTETANWIPWQSRPAQVLTIGLAFALPVAYVTDRVPALGFDLPLALTAAMLVFLVLGHKVPVAHHIALSAVIGVTVLGGPGWGIALGVFAAFLGELAACLLVYRGDTVIDPPSVALLGTWVLAVLLAPALPDDPGTVWPTVGVVALTGLGFAATWALKRRTSTTTRPAAA